MESSPGLEQGSFELKEPDTNKNSPMQKTPKPADDLFFKISPKQDASFRRTNDLSDDTEELTPQSGLLKGQADNNKDTSTKSLRPNSDLITDKKIRNNLAASLQQKFKNKIAASGTDWPNPVKQDDDFDLDEEDEVMHSHT